MSAVIDDVEVIYPESDGKPMADNTLQWDWMVIIVSELREIFAGQEVFIAGDLFWYPVKGSPRIVTAPDGLVAFGRPPGYRGSYRQWEEGNVAPHVVFEVLSPNNTDDEMADKLAFYDRHGVEEYYFIDPYEPTALGYVRQNGTLTLVDELSGFVSPRLKVRFELEPDEVRIFGPDGREFQDRIDRVQQIEDDLRNASANLSQTSHELEQARKAADEAGRMSEAYRKKLRELGIDPDQLEG
jgi:Uma2 family endonuclease